MFFHSNSQQHSFKHLISSSQMFMYIHYIACTGIMNPNTDDGKTGKEVQLLKKETHMHTRNTKYEKHLCVLHISHSFILHCGINAPTTQSEASLFSQELSHTTCANGQRNRTLFSVYIYSKTVTTQSARHWPLHQDWLTIKKFLFLFT